MRVQGIDTQSGSSGEIDRALPERASLAEKLTAWGTAASAVFAGISILISYFAIQRADMALDHHASRAREDNLNRVEEIFLQSYRPTGQSEDIASEHIRWRDSMFALGITLERIRSSSPAFYDKYLTDFPEKSAEIQNDATAKSIGVSLGFFDPTDPTGKRTRTAILSSDQERMLLDDITEMRQFYEDLRSVVWRSIERERSSFSNVMFDRDSVRP